MTRGNVAWEMKEMSKGKAAISTTVFPIINTTNGIVMCYTAITATATLSALCESQGMKFARGCLAVCVHTDAVATVLLMCNVGTLASTPSWYAVITAGVAV